MLKVTIFDCTDLNLAGVLDSVNKAVSWFKDQGITFEYKIVKGDSPDITDFESLYTGFGRYDILNDRFYEKQISKNLESDTDICLFCYNSLGLNAINLSEPTNVYKMVCAQAIMDNGEAWFYIRHELIHAFHQVLRNSGVLDIIDNQDAREQVAKVYFCADNATKQQIEIENLIDVKANLNKLVNNTTVTLVQSKLSQVIEILKVILNLRRKELAKKELWKFAYTESIKAGIDPDILCCTILAESNFDNDSKFINSKDSIDWGVCQINDYWWIGDLSKASLAGEKYFESVEWVLAHPKECILWMINQFKRGRKSDWCTYSSGKYKAFYNVQQEFKKTIK